MSDATRMLERVQPGETETAEELLPLDYEELRRLGAYRMVPEPPGQRQKPTDHFVSSPPNRNLRELIASP